MLEVRGLTVAYGKHRALEDVSLTVRPGEIVVILGANGAGKSTLLKAIAGICEGSVRGSVTMGGEPVAGLPAHRVVERGIALVPEGRGIFGDLTVRENLMLGANPDRARAAAAANLDRLIGLFPKLRERAGQVARTMSGGEQQMVAIGRAMMSNPTILMLDEPSLGLSPLLSRELFQTLKRVRETGLGILLVEQNARLSLAIADRGYLLDNGRITHEAPAAALARDPAVQAAYLGGAAGHSAPARAAAAAPAPSAAPADLPEPPRPRAAPPRSVPAGDLVGLDIAALVARAADRAQPAPAAVPRALPAGTAPARAPALQAALSAIESAAAGARSRAAVPLRPLPPLRPARAPEPAPAGLAAHAPAASLPQPPAPEAAAPGSARVEVWRRRPGSSQFDRMEP
jgi:branched-chain amino acid transport system ATP-binding protein